LASSLCTKKLTVVEEDLAMLNKMLCIREQRESGAEVRAPSSARVRALIQTATLVVSPYTQAAISIDAS
jgi:hypothetical protein